MLRLTARRLRGLLAAAGLARLQASSSVAECIPSCSHHALVHTEAADKTAYSPRKSGRSPRREDSRPLDSDRHVAQAQYPSSRRRNDAYAAPRADYRPQRAQRERSDNPYKAQMWQDSRRPRESSRRTSRPQYPAHFKRDEYKAAAASPQDRFKLETKEKIKAAHNLVKQLPPLTDEDYQAVYQELMTYDEAPASPSQARLNAPTSPALPSPQLAETEAKTAKERLAELAERLSKRVPETGEVPLTVQPPRREEDTLASILARLRSDDALPLADEASTETKKDVHSSILKDSAREVDDVAEVEEGDLLAGFPLSSTATSLPQSYEESPLNLQGSPSVRHRARQRGKIFYALGQLLPPTPGIEPDKRQLIIGKQPKDSVVINIASQQEWSALVLDAADQTNLTDVLTTFEFMRKAGVAIYVDLLAAAVRLLSKNQKIIPVLLRYLEEYNAKIPAIVHHEVVVGYLTYTSARTPTTRAERYLRALETSNTPALPQTYAAVIKHIFTQRRQTGLRSRAWDLYGHMRLVAHPVPSVEVYNAMMYGCALDARTAPERALDLFTEMVEEDIKPNYETYLSLIRACATDKAKDSPYYFEALRLLKELLERGFQPERDVFNSILEGAKTRGDLGRARWIVSNMLQIAARSEDPAKNPLAPDAQTFHSLFLTAATYYKMIKPASRGKMTMQDTSPESASAEDIVVQEATAESAQDTQDQSTSKTQNAISAQALEQAETTAGQEETSHSTTSPEESSSALSQAEHSEYWEGSALHPLYRPEMPGTRNQVLHDFKQIMGTLLEANGRDTRVLDDPRNSDENTLSGEGDASYSFLETREDQGANTYFHGLDRGTMKALQNVSIGTYLINGYLTLLFAYKAERTAMELFKTGYSDLGLRATHQSWDIVYAALDSASRPVDAKMRQKVREQRASEAESLLPMWREYLQDTLADLAQKAKAEAEKDPNQPPNQPQTPPWFARHIERVYAHTIGCYARASNVDKGFETLQDFIRRFPAKNIRLAAENEEIKPGPAYLVQLSSYLYPETMDRHVYGKDAADTAIAMTGGRAVRSPLPSAQVNNYNLWGLPPILSYQMVYPLFHRLKEDEDPRADEILQYMREYRAGLRYALQLKDELEKRAKSGSLQREARREIIGVPGEKKGGPKAFTASQVLSMKERKEAVRDVLPLADILKQLQEEKRLGLWERAASSEKP